MRDAMMVTMKPASTLNQIINRTEIGDHQVGICIETFLEDLGGNQYLPLPIALLPLLAEDSQHPVFYQLAIFQGKTAVKQ